MSPPADGDGSPGTRRPVVVVGSGIAGLGVAIRLARAGRPVVVLTKDGLADGATAWAQGGIAAAVDPIADSPEAHSADTQAAGAGLCDPDAVEILVSGGAGAVDDLVDLGAVFDRAPDGGLELSREGGHRTSRVVHAGGASTGAEIERALAAAVSSSGATVLEGWCALELLVDGGRCGGVRALGPAGDITEVEADDVVVATGGVGQVYAVTTNPPQATGDGVAMALRAGVAVADVELVQFHPTALHLGAAASGPRVLLSEAIRGAGAVLRDPSGRRFVDELAPRDVVSRAMAQVMAEQGATSLWLDATGVESFAAHFPAIARRLGSVGLDPATDWLPVAPAAHYACGGILTDLDAATLLPGLWAVGEAACTGVHGANRLASNSLLEGVVFGRRCAEALLHDRRGPLPTGALGAAGVPLRPLARESLTRGFVMHGSPGRLSGTSPLPDVASARQALRSAMSAGAGLVRTADGLAEAEQAVQQLAAAWRSRGDLAHADAADRRALAELADLTEVAAAIVAGATARAETRGAHTRAEFAGPSDRWRCRLVQGNRFAALSADTPASPYDRPRAGAEAR